MFEVGVIPKSNANSSIDRDHLDAYVHNAHEWKIGLYEDGIYFCAPYNGYEYGFENKSTMASRNRPNQSQPPILGTVKSFEAIDKGATTSASKGEKRKQKAPSFLSTYSYRPNS